MTQAAEPRLRRYTPRPTKEALRKRDEELRDLWARGWHVAAIAAYLGVTENTVLNRRLVLGLPLRGGRKSAPTIPKRPPPECVRCGQDVYKRSDYCRSCSALINARIARWMDSDRDLTLAEFAAEVGLKPDAVHQRILRLRRSRVNAA